MRCRAGVREVSFATCASAAFQAVLDEFDRENQGGTAEGDDAIQDRDSGWQWWLWKSRKLSHWWWKCVARFPYLHFAKPSGVSNFDMLFVLSRIFFCLFSDVERQPHVNMCVYVCICEFHLSFMQACIYIHVIKYTYINIHMHLDLHSHITCLGRQLHGQVHTHICGHVQVQRSSNTEVHCICLRRFTHTHMYMYVTHYIWYLLMSLSLYIQLHPKIEAVHMQIYTHIKMYRCTGKHMRMCCAHK